MAYVYRQLHGLPDLGRNLHVQSYHKQLEQRASDADRSHPYRNPGVYAELAGRMVREPPRHQCHPVHIHVLQLRMDLGLRREQPPSVYGLGLL
ncbi:hypothetical protein D3C76_1693560 [compost metagenome]